MIRIVLLMAMAVMLAWSPASLAHGPEGHGGEDGTETASPAAPDAASETAYLFRVSKFVRISPHSFFWLTIKLLADANRSIFSLVPVR